MFNFLKKTIKKIKLSPVEKYIGWESAANIHFIKVLQDMADNDKEKYFIATDERTRNLIKGSWMRTNYLIKRLNMYTKMNPKEKQKVEGMRLPRYEE